MSLNEEIAVSGVKTECEFRFDPTNEEFWDLFDRSKNKLLRGLIANGILFVWDATFYTHDQAFEAIKNSSGLITDKHIHLTHMDARLVFYDDYIEVDDFIDGIAEPRVIPEKDIKEKLSPYYNFLADHREPDDHHLYLIAERK